MNDKTICFCCLTTKLPLIKLINCKHVLFLEKILDNKIDFSKTYVCIYCHNMIKKIDRFRCQVEESISYLNKGMRQLIVEPKKLQMSNIEINYTVNNEPIKSEVTISSSNIKQEIKSEEAFIILVENNDFYGLNEAIPLKVKKEKVKVKKQTHKGIKENKLQYEGKIRIVKISHEELMEERRRDSVKISYINLPFKCEDCIIGFDHKVTLDLHMEQKHSTKEGGYMCEVCKSVLRTESSLKVHKMRHSRRYECIECGNRKVVLYSMIKHYNDKHGAISTNYTCKVCGFTTDSNRKYRYHREKHRDKIECQQCGNSFVSRTALRTHILTLHEQSDRSYVCSVCGKTYRYKSSLLAHQAVHATGPSPDSFCDTCKTHFRNRQALRHHLKTHSKHIRDSDKKFVCDECGLKVLTKRVLEEHIDWAHLKKQKYVCKECPKVFQSDKALKRHKVYVHEKRRPPKNKICDHCGQGFTTMQILRTHVRTHTGERPLQCARCPASFAHSAALYTHNKRLHKQ